MKITSICPKCEKPFEHEKCVKRKYCSKGCSKENPRQKTAILTKTCPICNKEFSFQWFENRQTCSRKCYDKQIINNHEIKKCIVCFNSFESIKSARRKYCSKNCQYAARKNYKPSIETRQKTSKSTIGMPCKNPFGKGENNPNWAGGLSTYEISKRWKQKNPEKVSHYKSTRYARKKGACGSHTFEEWNKLKTRRNNCCVRCNRKTKLTKDHIIPLSKGGSDYINNIQPLCKSCNSIKSDRIGSDVPPFLRETEYMGFRGVVQYLDQDV